MELQMVRPCFRKDRGSQRCRIPAHLFSQLHLSVGCYLTISFKDLQQRTVCSAWPWKCQTGAYLQCDDTVRTAGVDRLDAGRTFAPSAEHLSAAVKFERFEVGAVDRITVSVLFDEYENVERWTAACNRSALEQTVKSVLEPLVVVAKCVVSCEHEILVGAMFGIKRIIVTRCTFRHDAGFIGGRVDDETLVSIADCITVNRYRINNGSINDDDDDRISLGALQGPRKRLEDLLEECSRLEQLGIKRPRGLLLIGPPGTGKTALVKSVTRERRCALVYIPGASICSANPGESERTLRNFFRRAHDASKEGACVLFVDQLDTFVSWKSRRQVGGVGGDHGGRLVSQLATLLDGHNAVKNLAIVGATNSPNSIDHALRRPGRFDQELFIGFPTKREREDILKTLCRRLPTTPPDFDFGTIAESTVGYVGADLALLCKEVVSNVMTKTKTKTHELGKIEPISDEDFRRLTSSFRPSMLRTHSASVDIRPIHWDDIGGLEDIKLQLKQAVEWPIQHAKVYRRLGLNRPTSILLHGPPGCCKTTLVRAAATACNATFLSIGAAQLYSPYVGDSEKILAQLFHQARLAAPTVVFLDEIDSLVGKRSFGSRHGVNEKVLSTLLNEMDGIGLAKVVETEIFESHHADESNVDVEESHVVVIAATNRLDLLDDAVLRPGRFDRVIYIPPPDKETRRSILNVLLKNMPAEQLDVEVLSEKTQNFTGADLVNLCQEAALLSLTEDVSGASSIQWRHFNDSLAQVKPSFICE